MGNAQTNVETVKQFIQAVEERRPPSEIVALLHPAFEQVEYPNRIAPQGAKRGRHELTDAMERGRKAISRERYDIQSVTGAGERVSAEIAWEGTTAVALGTLPAGSVLRAHICEIFELQDGLIRRLRNYDCYEPF